MEKRSLAWKFIFSFVLLICMLTTVWYTWHSQVLLATQRKLTAQLDTSQKREVKQQVEYDQALADLPVALALAAEFVPQADALQAQVDDLKVTRKALRTEIAANQEALSLLDEERIALVDTLRALQADLATCLSTLTTASMP